MGKYVDAEAMHQSTTEDSDIFYSFHFTRYIQWWKIWFCFINSGPYSKF